MKYLFIIDEPETLIFYKDTTIALIKECLSQGIEAHFTNISSLSIDKKQNVIIESYLISKLAINSIEELIVERYKESKLPEIDKSKYLVPKDVGQRNFAGWNKKKIFFIFNLK